MFLFLLTFLFSTLAFAQETIPAGHLAVDLFCPLDVRDQTGGLVTVLPFQTRKVVPMGTDTSKVNELFCRDAHESCVKKISNGVFQEFKNPYCAKPGDLAQNPALGRRAVPLKNQKAAVNCFYDPTLTSASLGIGYLTGQGWMRCDDGNAGYVSVWGLNFFSAGISKRDRGANMIGLSGLRRLDDVSGTYHGIGIQASTLFVNAEAYAFSGPGDATMYWVAPPVGIEVGALYRTLTLDVDREESGVQERPFVAAPAYTAALLALGNLKFELIELGGKDPALYISTDQTRIPRRMLPLETGRLTMSLSIVRKTGWDGTVAHYGPELRDLFLDQPYVNRSLIPDDRAIVVGGLQPGYEYCVVARPLEHAGGYPITYEYCFDYPEAPRAWEPLQIQKQRAYWD